MLMDKIYIDSLGDKYEILIGNKILENSSEYLSSILKSENVTVITDNIVDKLYFNVLKNSLKNSGYKVNKIVIKNGEQSKNIDVCNYIYSELLKVNHRRSDAIIALGGGVVGDIAGFVSATYLRGVDFIQIPTTLLSQVDSSVGGKVGVNLKEGKNLVGSFYNPRLVIIDINVLNTLDSDLIRDGLGEIIKYSYIFNNGIKDILDDMKSIRDVRKKIDILIRKSIIAKKYFVEKDMFDKSDRMILNYGHTFGHVIEKKYGYGVISHGQAVAEGIYLMNDFAYKNGFIENNSSKEIRELLTKFGFRNDIKLKYKDIVEVVKNDKKTFLDSINLIMVGKEAFIKEIDISEFIKLLSEYFEV